MSAVLQPFSQYQHRMASGSSGDYMWDAPLGRIVEAALGARDDGVLELRLELCLIGVR